MSSEGSNITKIIVAIIGAAAVILGALISGFFLLRSEEIKQETELTKAALAAGASPLPGLPAAPAPTSIPAFTPTFPPVIQPTIPMRCGNTIPRSDVQSWATVGSTAKSNIQSYLNQYQDKILSQNQTMSGFARGDPLWAGLLIATDFGNGESEFYSSYPVTPIVHYRSWGLFEVTGNFTAPNSGWCATIVQ